MKLRKVMLSLLLSVSLYFEGYALDTTLPTDWVYTEQGIVWYKQSSYNAPGALGYWEGYDKSYFGAAVNMYSPTMSGCGPISFAIIATNVRQELITPKEVIQYYCDTGLYTGNGSTHDSGRKAAQHYGLSFDEPVTSVSSDRSLDQEREVAWMREHLERGHWILILVKNQPNVRNSIWPYTGGHFVAIHGYQNGNTFVYDSSRQEEVEKAYDLNEVWENIRSPYTDGCKNKHMTAIW